MGYRSMDEIIGRSELLSQMPEPLAKTSGLDLTVMTAAAVPSPLTSAAPLLSSARRALPVKTNGRVLDDEILAMPGVSAAIASGGSVAVDVAIVNVDRSTCARVAGQIAKRYGDAGFTGKARGLPSPPLQRRIKEASKHRVSPRFHRHISPLPRQVALNFSGSAGQSFAAFVLGGMEVHLVGEANDYVGKGMAGGVVSIVPPPASKFTPGDAILVRPRSGQPAERTAL